MFFGCAGEGRHDLYAWCAALVAATFQPACPPTYLPPPGFNTFDLADIYGPAEEITGAYHKQYGPKEGLFYTKVRR